MIITRPIPVLAPQRSEIWHNARRPCVTGSDVKKTIIEFSETAINAAIREITGLRAITAPYKLTEEYQYYANEKDKFELFEEAHMEVPETMERMKYRRNIVANRIYPVPFEQARFQTEAMKWGVINEPAAIAYYQMKTKRNVQVAPFFLHQTIDTETGEVEQLKAGASPDGLVEDFTRPEGLQLGVVECKCLIPENHLYEVIKAGHAPIEFIPQIQMEMWITGRSFCDFIGFDSRAPEGLKVLIKRIERDDEYISKVLEPSVRRFLLEVENDERWFRALIREGQEQQVNTTLNAYALSN